MNPTIRLSPSDLHACINGIEHAYRDGEIDRDERDALIREALTGEEFGV